MTEIIREEVFRNILQTDGLSQSVENIMYMIARIEAERDEARAKLAAARKMLHATGAALADATKRIAALEKYMQNNPKDTGLTKEDYEAIYGWGGQD